MNGDTNVELIRDAIAMLRANAKRSEIIDVLEDAALAATEDAARTFAARGGRSRSLGKAAAARANGRRGGRPVRS